MKPIKLGATLFIQNDELITKHFAEFTSKTKPISLSADRLFGRSAIRHYLFKLIDIRDCSNLTRLSISARNGQAHVMFRCSVKR